jgi:Polysaccharide pyruvyl transferase
MKLIYYRSKVPNFGDDLNGCLWQAISPGIFEREPESGFVGIGTIIGMPCAPDRLHVFSSGIGNNDIPSGWHGKAVEYWCVRGPISARILELPEERAITDGAILAPLVSDFPIARGNQTGTLIIPHFQTLQYGGWSDVARVTGFELVDPRADPRSVVQRISSARLVLTESLHGAILADVYGVPWAAFATSGNFGIPKWVDWCLSMHLPFELMVVPPPTIEPLLVYGRPAAGFGATIQFDAEAALARFVLRVSPPSVKGTVKRMLRKVPGITKLARARIDASVDRTAEGLSRLAKSYSRLSAESLRDDRRQQMLDRLAKLQSAV